MKYLNGLWGGIVLNLAGVCNEMLKKVKVAKFKKSFSIWFYLHKMKENTFSTLFNLVLMLTNSDFVHFFKDGTNLKIFSEI